MSSPFREEMPASLVARSPAKTSQDRYRCIAGLDQQLDNINWENMTEVITEPEHCSNMDAVEFIQDIIETVLERSSGKYEEKVLTADTNEDPLKDIFKRPADPVLASGESSVNTSFASATLDSEPEYESATETASSGTKVSRDIIEDLVQKSKEKWMPATSEDSRSEDSHLNFGDEMKPEVVASQQQFTRYRSQENSVGSDENLSPVSRINGSFSTGCLSPAVLPYYPKRALPSQLQAAPSPGLSRQLLGIGLSNHQPPELQSPGLSDLFRKVAVRDEDEVEEQILVRNAYPANLSVGDDSDSVGTPADVAKLSSTFPISPSKSFKSPSDPPVASDCAKRHLFDSPIVSNRNNEDQAEATKDNHTSFKDEIVQSADVLASRKFGRTKSKTTMIGAASNVGTSPKSVKFSKNSPTKISPKRQDESKSEDKIQFLLDKIKAMKRDTEASINSSVSSAADISTSFALPCNVSLPELLDCTAAGEEDGSCLDGSLLASKGGDTNSFLHVSSLPPRAVRADDLTNLILHHQSMLLDKDKEIAKVKSELMKIDSEAEDLRKNLVKTEENNGQMEVVVKEFEETIQQLIRSRETETKSYQATKEKAIAEKEQAIDDLQGVERSFGDISRRYERMKDQIGSLKKKEDLMKPEVKVLHTKLKKEEEKYATLKSDAEENLRKVNERLAEVKESKAAEIMKLTAQLKKAEMEEKSLEMKVKMKEKENVELTQICDELIAKVGK